MRRHWSIYSLLGLLDFLIFVVFIEFWGPGLLGASGTAPARKMLQNGGVGASICGCCSFEKYYFWNFDLLNNICFKKNILVQGFRAIRVPESDSSHQNDPD